MTPDRAAILRLAKAWGSTPDGDWIETPTSRLLPVRRGDQALMIKAADPEEDEADHPALLAHWGGRAMVRLLEAEGTVSLMERAGAATLAGLAGSGGDVAAMTALLDAARALAQAPVWTGPARPRITQRFDGIRNHLTVNPPDPADLPLFDRALAMQARLTADQSGWRLLHADLHHFNLLPSSRGWLAIDPKGVIGPLSYEVAPMLCNPLMDPVVHLPGRYRAMAEMAASVLHLDLQEVLDWGFCHLAQCAAWTDDPAERPFWLASLRIAAAEVL